MVLRRFPILISFLFTVFLFGCSSSTPFLGTVGKEPITLEEFEEMYAKNNGGWERSAQSTVEDRERFLDLLVKYKLKLQEAHSKGLLQDSAIQDELKMYRASIASSYMIEKELVEPKLRQMYERRKEVLRVSHILVRVGPDAAPAETLKAYNKILGLQERLSRSGFETVARSYSEDPSASLNNGDLGWFTEGRMVGEFEDACYNLKAGEITRFPARTQFGYHLIKLTERRPNRGSVQVSHILKRFPRSLQDTAMVRDSVNLIHTLLKRRALDFSQAVLKYSDDTQSNARGGDIGTYDPSGLPPDLGALFLTTPLDSVTPPYKASYGFHIFRITAINKVPDYQDVERDLRQRYQQSRYAPDYAAYLHSLKKGYHLSHDVKLLYQLSHAFDSTKTGATHGWSDTIASDWRSRTLFTYGTEALSVQNLLDHIEASQEFQKYPLTPANIEMIVERVAESRILDMHARGIEARHPAFTHLMQEYQNGVLIYRLEQDEVWQKITVNDSLLRAYYETNKRKFRWTPRVNIAEIHVKADSAARKLYQRLLQGENFGVLAAGHTIRPGFKEKRGEWGFLPIQTNALTTAAGNMSIDSIAPPQPYEGGWSIIKVIAKDNHRVKTYEEALPELTSHYQEYASKQREKEWIESLKQRYGVVLNAKLVSEAFKSK